MVSCAAIWRRRLLWGAVRFAWAVSCVRRTPPVRAEEGAGSACGAEKGAGSACRAGQPAFMRAYRIRGARGFLWGAVRFVQAVSCVRRIPRRRRELRAGSACGAKRVQAQPAGRASPLSCRASPIRRARRFLWGVVRFVQAVSCVRRIPRRRRELRAGSACGAEEHAGSACRVIRRRGIPMGSRYVL